MKKIMTLFGTRPEAIKMAPLVQRIAAHPDLRPIVCVTGQHREMLDQVLRTFAITPDVDLNVMRPDQRLAQTTATILTEVDAVLERLQPDWVLVQGDTTTVMAASLAAFYRRVKIAHVEAGLRTYDKYAPFPEEANRRIADALADLYFAPTETARANLIREGAPEARVIVTGNSVVDALLMVRERVRGRPLTLERQTGALRDKRLIVVTSHRRESFGEPFADICRALRAIAQRYHALAHIVYPVHLNPNVQLRARALLGGVPNITLTDPVDYETMVALMDRAYLILTDSGGMQEEAPSLGKPLLILRDKTERVEAVACGAAVLVGTDADAIVRETVRLMEDPAAYARMAAAGNPYGDGRASQRMVEALLAFDA